MNSVRQVKPGNLLAALIFAIVFILLGVWQLNRAMDLRAANQKIVESAAQPIEMLVKPKTNLSGNAINKLVLLDGNYLKSYSAPNQEVKGDSQRQTLEVRLMKLKSGSGILVVRGIDPLAPQKLDGDIKVLGRLLPRQSSDLAKGDGNQLTRIDPALVVGHTNLDMLDGYVIAISEKNSVGQKIYSQRIPANRAVPKVAGYFWQHLTYVGIWWLFAVLVLIAPFYDLLRNRKRRVG